ncbi:MAG: putative ATP-binding protein, partial [uncultured Nocardioidaceae bacterium]
ATPGPGRPGRPCRRGRRPVGLGQDRAVPAARRGPGVAGGQPRRLLQGRRRPDAAPRPAARGRAGRRLGLPGLVVRGGGPRGAGDPLPGRLRRPAGLRHPDQRAGGHPDRRARRRGVRPGRGDLRRPGGRTVPRARAARGGGVRAQPAVGHLRPPARTRPSRAPQAVVGAGPAGAVAAPRGTGDRRAGAGRRVPGGGLRAGVRRAAPAAADRL